MRAAFHRLTHRFAAEHGMALVMALGVSVVLGATVTTTIAYTASGSRAATRSKTDQVALSLAEAGLNNALAQLHASTSPALASALPSEQAPAKTEVPGIGKVQWYGKLGENKWTLFGVGRVPSADPGLAEVVRRVSTRVRLGSVSQGSANNAVWNYVFADDNSGCTTVGNQSVLNVPLYVRGSLCLQNSARVTGHTLQVGGTLTILGSQASVGVPSSDGSGNITQANIGWGCTTDDIEFHDPCTVADRVYANTVTNRPTGLTKPPVDLAYWYANAMPGPRHPCSITSGPISFDTDAVMNRSHPAFDLTPATAYDCRVLDANGAVVGQLSWQPGAPGTLTIAGTIFIDGDVVMGQYSRAVYRGKATLYASGRFTIGQQSQLCGIVNCTSQWKATENLLAIVAGQPTGDGVVISNYSVLQGAVYAVADYREGNNSQCWGPIIANRLYIQNSSLNHFVPIGTLLPGMPATTEEAMTLTNEPGSWGS